MPEGHDHDLAIDLIRGPSPHKPSELICDGLAGEIVSVEFTRDLVVMALAQGDVVIDLPEQREVPLVGLEMIDDIRGPCANIAMGIYVEEDQAIGLPVPIIEVVCALLGLKYYARGLSMDGPESFCLLSRHKD